MKTHVCQNCGTIVRKLGAICDCGSVVTEHSTSGVLQLCTAMAPNTVAVPTDPLLAEKMICKLHHDEAASANAATSDSSSQDRQVLSPNVLSYIHGLADQLKGYTPNDGGSMMELAEKLPPTEEIVEITRLAGDFFSDTANKVGSSSVSDSGVPELVKAAIQSAFADEPQQKTVLKEASDEPDPSHTQELYQQLVDAKMTPQLPSTSPLGAPASSRQSREKKKSKEAKKQTTAPTFVESKPRSLSLPIKPIHLIAPLVIAGTLGSGFLLFANKPVEPAMIQPNSPLHRMHRTPMDNRPLYKRAPVRWAQPAKNHMTGHFPVNARGYHRDYVNPAPTPVQDEPKGPWDFLFPKGEAPASVFFKILIGCIFFGICLVQISLKFFGMNGLINIWEREKYIPASIMPQHLKLMNELGRRKHGALLLGERVEWKWHQFFRPRQLFLPSARRDRNPHILALGGGAKGKTRLLASMVINDIKNDDRAVVVIDSEGSLVELIKSWLGSCPEASKILRRVSIIDPCRPQSKLGFNPLACTSPDNFQSMANAIVMGFKAIYTESHNQQNQWTEQTANILRSAVLLLMLNDRSLDDLPLLLSDNDFRDVLLEKIEKNPEWKTLVGGWSNYKRLARTEQWINWIEPILNRVQPLLADQRISRMLTSKDNCVDLTQVIEEKRILLVRVPEGQLEKGGNLLGSLIVSGLRQAGLAHFERNHGAAKPSSLYLDEMNNFLDADSFEAICSDLRKVQIGVVSSLKTLQDLTEEFRNKVTLNVGTMALFSLAKKDADLLGPTIFRIDGRKIKKVRLGDIINPINATPNMDLASDEEKININRLVGQDERHYFCHLVGTEAGVFRMKAPEFSDIPRGDVNWDLVEQLYENQDDDEDAELLTD